MSTKTCAIAISAVFAASLIVTGCSHTITGADGSKVTVGPNGHMETTDPNGNKVTMDTQGGTTTLQSKDAVAQVGNGTYSSHDNKGNSVAIGTGISEADLGLPFYPGSTEAPGGTKATNDKGATTVISYRNTNDDPSKVVEFYTAKLGKPDNTATIGAMATANWKQGKNTTALMVQKVDNAQRITLMVGTEK